MNALRGIIAWLLTPFFNLMSTRIKRLILIPALFGRITQQSDVDIDTLHKLNQALHLTSTHGYEGAMLLPMKIHSLIWSGKEVGCLDKEICNTKNKDLMIERICRLIPKNLQYKGNEKDIATLIEIMPTLTKHA